eukprot:6512896-Prymnesium_polylepis.1
MSESVSCYERVQHVSPPFTVSAALRVSDLVQEQLKKWSAGLSQKAVRSAEGSQDVGRAVLPERARSPLDARSAELRSSWTVASRAHSGESSAG